MFDGGQKAAFEQQTFLAFAELKVEFVGFAGGFVFHGHLARLDLRWQVVEAQHVAEVEIVVVGRICEGHWDDRVVDEVGLVDTCEALGDDGLDAEIEWREGCVFAAGTLA